MPADKEEMAEAKAEGVKFCFLSAPAESIGKDGKVTGMEYDDIVNGIGFVPTPVGGKGPHIHRVGDCVSIGNLRTAIWRAWDVAMKI